MDDAYAVIDDALPPELHRRVKNFLGVLSWDYGWRSDAFNPGAPPFLHRHFAGNWRPDHVDPAVTDCESELANLRALYTAWAYLRAHHFTNHTMVRCYANAHPYGADGTTHTDSVSDDSLTAVYYVHENWHCDWGGETVLFNGARDEIVCAVFPKPNRLFVFRGNIPHVARGITRLCPVLRVTLMFKLQDGRDGR